MTEGNATRGQTIRLSKGASAKLKQKRSSVCATFRKHMTMKVEY